MPLATLGILLVTGITTSLQGTFPPLLPLLQRTPTALVQHQWWRLLTPLLVHSDGWPQIAFNFPALLLVGTLAERTFGSYQLLFLYLTCGLIGEVAGYAWQPFGAGASVAGAGLLGALAFCLLRGPVPAKIGGALLVVGAGLLTWYKDIHGPPLLSGVCLAGALFPEIAHGFWDRNNARFAERR